MWNCTRSFRNSSLKVSSSKRFCKFWIMVSRSLILDLNCGRASKFWSKRIQSSRCLFKFKLVGGLLLASLPMLDDLGHVIKHKNAIQSSLVTSVLILPIVDICNVMNLSTWFWNSSDRLLSDSLKSKRFFTREARSAAQSTSYFIVVIQESSKWPRSSRVMVCFCSLVVFRALLTASNEVRSSDSVW